MNQMSATLLQAIINGVLLGGIYVCISIGLSFAFGVMHIINVAQGEFVMLGAFVSYWVCFYTGIDPIFTFPLTFCIFFAVGYFLQKFLVTRVMDAPALMSLVLFFGLSIILSNMALMAWSPITRIVTTPLSGANIPIGEMSVPIVRLCAFFIALVSVYALFLFLRKTRMGLAIMATSEMIGDKEAAMLMGINVKKIHAITLGLGTGTAAMAGALVSSIASISPTMGGIYTLFAFFITVLGGMGYLLGTLVGGITLGILQSFVITYYNINVVYFILFLILYLVLIFRPRGVFGKGV
jgi:branched-chain amino acid transport system permease protein